MRPSSTQRMIALASFLAALAQAASSESPKDEETIRERFHRPRGRHLRRSPSANLHHQERRRAETDDVVHESAPKIDENIALEPKPIEDQDFCSDPMADPVARFDVEAALEDLEANNSSSKASKITI